MSVATRIATRPRLKSSSARTRCDWRLLPWIAAAAYSKYGHPVGDRELLDQLSPLLRAHALTAPLLLVHGLNDTNVPPSESQQMFDALRALGRTVEQLLFDDDGHDIDKRENRAVLVKAMSEWLTRAFAPTRNS